VPANARGGPWHAGDTGVGSENSGDRRDTDPKRPRPPGLGLSSKHPGHKRSQLATREREAPGESVKTKVDDEGTTPAARRSASRVGSGARLRGPGPSRFAAASVLLLSASPALASESLNLQPDLPILGGLIVGFALLILPANQLIFKPIFRALDERRSRIEGARNRARQIERDADNVLADYQARIREARAEADQTRKEQIDAAREEHAVLTLAARSDAEGQIDRARQTLAGELASAREATRAGVRDLAQAAAEQILGRSIS